MQQKRYLPNSPLPKRPPGIAINQPNRASWGCLPFGAQHNQNEVDLSQLSPRSKINYRYKTQKRIVDDKPVSRSFISWLDSLDLFAVPVIKFNMRGKEQVSTRCGLLFTICLFVIVIFFTLSRLIQITMINGRIETLDNIAYGQASDETLNINDWLDNLAFIATQSDDLEVFPVTWQLEHVKRQYGEGEERTEIPLKKCSQS